MTSIKQMNGKEKAKDQEVEAKTHLCDARYSSKQVCVALLLAHDVAYQNSTRRGSIALLHFNLRF